MILIALIAIPLAAAFIAWPLGRRGPRLARWVALAAFGAGLVLVAIIWINHSGGLTVTGRGPYLEQVRARWVPQLGIHFFVALDGLSLLLVALCFLIGLLSVLVSWREITERVGFFHFHLLWAISALIGVFLALDLFLFYFFFEMMLVPMYFLIAIWGHERRVYAAIKFFIFTQVGGLLMLVGILALYFFHGHATGVYTFDYTQLLGTPLSLATAVWMMLAFFAAFAIKLPVVPLHTWLPDAHTEASTAGSLVLAGLLIKIGAYGMIRFLVPLFPAAAFKFAPVAMGLAVLGILYGAILAFAQRDFKRLVAYTSVSHMGFVLLGIFAWNSLALQGAVLEIVCHALSTGGLFALAGVLQERTGTREMARFGGLWGRVSNMGGVAMILALASLGLPGLGNFVAEFLILAGAWRVSIPATVLAAVGLVAATIYALWVIQAVFQGRELHGWSFADLSPRERGTFAALIAPLLFLGIYPQPVLGTARQALDNLQARAQRTAQAAPAAAQKPPGAAATSAGATVGANGDVEGTAR
jgi:NADH-quinone oxidoreductase subunit M